MREEAQAASKAMEFPWRSRRYEIRLGTPQKEDPTPIQASIPGKSSSMRRP